MNYLVLHVDLDFIVGVVSTDDGNSYPITNGKDDMLYLYFYNNPHTNKITFGKSYRDYVNKEVYNYYGKFFSIITDGHTTFKRGEFQKEAIELLNYSDLLETIKVKYAEVTRENKEDIHTLITFSLSISDLAKQKTVEYLKTQGFQIDSYTIPLAELVGYYPYSKKEFTPANGSTILLLSATNATLHLMKLVFSDNYFMLDGEVRKHEGMGIDPRRRALVGFVINQINISVGALNQNEIYSEIEKKEFKADEWLRKIDAKSKNDNSPICITESLSPMPNCIKQVLVKRSDIETFTNDFVNLLMDYFNAYKSDNLSGDIAGIFLMGDCFNNSLVKQRFSNLFRDDAERKKKLFTYPNKSIQDILSVYPKIDFHRYINEEERSKAKAEAEEKKIAEQRAFEDRQRKEQEMVAQKAATEQKAEENRKEAKKLFERAVELEKEEKFEDARVNTENAIALDKTNREYKQFLDDLKDKIKNLNDKNELYKNYLSNADKLLKDGELEKALEEYEAAKFVFDNAEIIAKIIEVKRLIKNSETQKKQIEQLVSEASTLVQNKKFDTAKDKIDTILTIDSSNAEAKKLLIKIDEFLKQQEKLYNDYIKSADKHFNSSIFTDALNDYKQALSIKPDDTYCLQQIDKISDTIQKQKENQEKCEKIMEKGDALFQDERWIDAQLQYQLALNLCPEVKSALTKLNECNLKIKEQEDTFTDLLLQANLFVNKGKLKEALEILEKARKIKPNNHEVKSLINKVRIKMTFGETPSLKETVKTPIKTENKNADDFWNSNPKKVLPIKNDDDFLGTKGNNSTPNKKMAEDDFFKREQQKTMDKDDFLGRKKKN